VSGRKESRADANLCATFAGVVQRQNISFPS
jgi:hypothetical protein